MEILFLKSLMYLGVGLLSSGINTVAIKHISMENALSAGAFAMLNTIVGAGVVVNLINDIHTSGWTALFAYAAGVGLGAFVGTRLNKKKD